MGLFTKSESEGLSRTLWYFNQGSGYFFQQSTKPLTIGYSLADSPAGLLAWIYEKLESWTDRYDWTDEEILTWVSLYLFSKPGPAASVQIYYEMRNAEVAATRKALQYTPVPLGVSSFPKDISPIPLAFCKALGPVVFQRRHGEGGHFAAYEKPEVLVNDIRDMFGKDGGAFLVAERLRSEFQNAPSM